MAVFIAASDEASGKTHRDTFRHGGFLAPEEDWFNIFAPLWDTRVLKGPPRIEYLHMTEIRSRGWRESHGLTRSEGEFRVDEAFGVIRAIPSLTPLAFRVNAGRVFDVIKKKLHFSSTNADRPFLPDYLAFSAYAFTVLEYVALKRPEATKVDFMIERKKGVTSYIQEFFDCMKGSAASLKRGHLVPLIGQLIPVDKDRVPVQAADLLCWYSQRAAENNLDARDVRRYASIAGRNGINAEWPDELIDELYASLVERLNDEELSGISEIRRSDEPVAEDSTQRNQGATGCGEESQRTKEEAET